MTALLEYAAVGKVFPAVVALQDVSFSVAGGEVRASWAKRRGQSTLLKILAGDYAPDSGSLRVNGVARVFKSPRESQAAGIAIIHQNCISRPNYPSRRICCWAGCPRVGFIQRDARAPPFGVSSRGLARTSIPTQKVRTLPIGKRQMIEIGKALLRDAARHRVRRAHQFAERARDQHVDAHHCGPAFRGPSHPLREPSHEEVLEISDTVTVLRDGRHVGDFLNKSLLTQDALISAMSGRTITDIYDYRARPSARFRRDRGAGGSGAARTDHP